MIGIQGETALDEVTKSPADAALSTTSTNSVQNKVITNAIESLFTHTVTLYSGTFSGGDDITLSDNINNYRAFAIVDVNADSEATQTINAFYKKVTYPAIIASIIDYNSSAGVLVLADVALISSDGIHYHCERSVQWNLDGNGITYFSTDQSSPFIIIGYR